MIIHAGREPKSPAYACDPHLICKAEKLDIVLRDFPGLPHRMEDLGKLNGVRYINDSKSTTIASLEWALYQMEPNTTLIAGGRHKGGDFGVLKALMQEKVKQLLAFGEARNRIKEAFADVVPIKSVETLDLAIEAARKSSARGETILFSPACASFDQFRDYRERGNRFKAILAHLREVLTPA